MNMLETPLVGILAEDCGKWRASPRRGNPPLPRSQGPDAAWPSKYFHRILAACYEVVTVVTSTLVELGANYRNAPPFRAQDWRHVHAFPA
jgi:hypothetical protein